MTFNHIQGIHHPMFHLLDLPYPIDALEPVISAQTLSFHHGKHLQAYVDNLNKLIAGTEYESLFLEEIVTKATGGVFNNAGQILNHNLYFTQFCPPSCHLDRAQQAEQSALFTQIIKQWGSIDAFKAEFVSKGVGLFGSGWVWLQADNAGQLSIGQYLGADNPVTRGLRPILTFDVWEHAYYLDYQNRRAEHLSKLWGIVDWGVVDGRYSSH